MDQAIIEQNAQLILHTNEVPAKVIKLADSLNLQSSTCIPLKPNQEPARVHICCVLAIEKLGERLGLPLPDTRKPPIPPAQYTKLLSQFRTTLIPESANSSSSSATNSPRRTPRAARKKAVNLLKNEIDGAEENDDDDEDFPDLELTGLPKSNKRRNNGARGNSLDFVPPEYDDDNDDDEDDENELIGAQIRTPRKRPPSGPRTGSPSPRKSPRKRISGPKPADIEAIGSKMGLETTTIDAVQTAFSQYNELVKDAWGLVYGLFVVVSDRAEPRMGMEHERRLVRALAELAPQVNVDRDEWISWVDRIVTGQTWITSISKRPEPQPHLIGAPGGWGLGTEFTLVE